MTRAVFKCDAPFLAELYTDKHTDGWFVGCTICGIIPRPIDDYDYAVTLASELEQITEHKHIIYPYVQSTEGLCPIMDTSIPVMLVWFSINAERTIKLAMSKDDFDKQYIEVT